MELKSCSQNTIVGWYHSHPGYGCWLSGIDVATQRLHQQHFDPFVAIVIDPKKTMENKSNVEIVLLEHLAKDSRLLPVVEAILLHPVTFQFILVAVQ